MSEQKTPRTDSATITNLGKILERKENASYVPVEFARTLERSNAELLAALELIDKRLRECASMPISAAEAYDSFYQSEISNAIAKAKGEA